MTAWDWVAVAVIWALAAYARLAYLADPGDEPAGEWEVPS